MPPLLLPVTAIYTALVALLILFLAYRVTMLRKGKRLGMGDDGDKDMAVAIRAHANAVEYAPISLLLLAVAELNGLGALWVHLFGAMIFASRAMHAYGFTTARGGVHWGRTWGIASGWLAILALALVDLAMPLLRCFA